MGLSPLFHWQDIKQLQLASTSTGSHISTLTQRQAALMGKERKSKEEERDEQSEDKMQQEIV